MSDGAGATNRPRSDVRIRIERQLDPERAADTLIAGEADGAPHQVGEALADAETDTGTLDRDLESLLRLAVGASPLWLVPPVALG